MNMPSEEILTREINFLDILPSDWIDQNGNAYVMQSVYACLFFSPARLNPPFVTDRIGEVQYLIGESEFEYLTVVPKFRGLNANGSPAIEFKVEKNRTPKSTYVIFFTKYKEGGEISENEALSRLESARGLVNALEGLNATYLHMFNQVLVLPGGLTTFLSPVMLNPASLPHPFLDIDRVPRLAASLDRTDQPLRTRILLALRWLDKSDRETDSLDSFLKTWFAIEVLAMPDTTNIGPLIDILAVIYEKTREEAKAYFQIGRLASLRSDIVHNGAIRPIHQQLHKYLQAIFVDVLLHLTNQPQERRVEQVLNDRTFTHGDWRP